MSAAEVRRWEEAGDLMHASRCAPKDLDLVKMPNGLWIPAIRPTPPTPYDFGSGEFKAESTAVVCAATLADMVILRGLTQGHPELTPMQRCHAWVYPLDEEGNPVGKPYGGATRELHEAVARKGSKLEAWVHNLGPPSLPFEPFAFQPDQHRSPEPAPTVEARKITGKDWPDGLAVIESFDCYPDYKTLAAVILGQCLRGPINE